MTACVGLVLVGSELVEGRTRDGNGAWLARRVTEEGATVAFWSVVSDAPEEIERALTDAAQRCALVLVSGGLGPTDDDRTREGLAQAAGVDLLEDAGAWASIEQALARRQRPCLPIQRRQALVPRGARWLPNPSGIAPGLALKIRAADVLAFPGVPTELTALFEQEGLPRLRALAGRVATALETLLTVGLPETEVALRLGDLASSREPAIGWYPHQGEVEVSIRAHGPGAAERARVAAALARQRLGRAVVDVPPGERIEHSVVALLGARRLRLTTAESLTGGLVARMLTRVPGASVVFPGGWITYSDEAKRRDLGVASELLRRHGAVSAEVAVAMAQGARGTAGVDVALATTGVAGPGDQRAPDGSSLAAGTAFVAVAQAGRPPVCERVFAPAEREIVQRRVAVAALDLLRRSLLA